MPRKARITLQDVADAVGLSRTAVSTALSGKGRLSPETRERVRREAARLGYRPDPLLSSLSRHRGGGGARAGSVIALVCADPHQHGWLEPVHETAAILGYRLEIVSWTDYPSERSLVQVLEARGTAGAIFVEQVTAPTVTPELWSNLRCVQCGPYPGGDDAECPFPIVRHDPYSATTLAWRKFAESGFRRIGLFLPTLAESLDPLVERSVMAYRMRQEESKSRSAALAPLLLSIARLNRENESCRRWLAEQRPDAVITGTKKTCLHLQECGLRVPEDVPVINLRQNAEESGIAGFISDRRQIVRAAILHLHSIIQYGEAFPAATTSSIVVKPIWKAGASFPGE